MSILKNAVQAIECGIEDFGVGTDARLKSAIRNVHAGVLLLFKEKLSQLSPIDSDEALLKHRVLPEIVGSTIVWKGRGPKTVDVQNIKDRFETLGVIVDWNDFNAINRIRNEIEHYYTTVTAKTIRESLAKSFGIVSSFLAAQLDLDAKSQFSADTWNVFIEVAEVYDREKQSCTSSHSNINAYSDYVADHAEGMSCDDCGSDLIFVQNGGGAECRSCSKTWDREELIVAIIKEASWGDNFVSFKGGGDPVTTDCPECLEPAFILEEMICAVCGESQQSECNRCGVNIPIEELDGSGYCGYCSHLMLKDD